MLPSDFHVHTEWSWDTAVGSMEESCRKAIELGLPSIAFTEHSDFTPWVIPPATYARLSDRYRAMIGPGNTLTPPGLNVDGYMESVERCRHMFPDLRIFCGVELGEPHWNKDSSRELLNAAKFDRVLGSSHSLNIAGEHHMVGDRFRDQTAEEVVRQYLGEVLGMVESSDSFAILAHIDYPIRSWPQDVAGPYNPLAFEEEYRAVLRTLASTNRILEVNTTIPLHSEIVGWWHEVGGEAVSFGSDAHDPSEIARNFGKAAEMVDTYGFRPGRHPHDFWTCRAPL